MKYITKVIYKIILITFLIILELTSLFIWIPQIFMIITNDFFPQLFSNFFNERWQIGVSYIFSILILIIAFGLSISFFIQMVFFLTSKKDIKIKINTKINQGILIILILFMTIWQKLFLNINFVLLSLLSMSFTITISILFVIFILVDYWLVEILNRSKKIVITIDELSM